MPKTVSQEQLQTVISKFNADITEYEIIEMDKYQGWSSTHLYLVVSADNNYILKAKTENQIAGYDNEVKICNALRQIHIQTRCPILTTDGKIFYKDKDFYWCLMTYIAGGTSHVNEYTETTVSSLAKCIEEYIRISNTESKLAMLDLKTRAAQKDIQALDQFIKEQQTLEKLKIVKGDTIKEIYTVLKGGFKQELEQIKQTSLIHNDINPRNILIDHASKEVISLIDWDHGCYGRTLKDISDAVAIFYDYLPITKANTYKKQFYANLTAPWFTTMDPETVELAFLFYYTVSKWRTILFYLDLLKKYDNKYGEEKRFINEMKQTYTKWADIIISFYS